MYYRISLEGYEITCVRSFSFPTGQQTFENMNQSIYSQNHPKKEHLLIWSSETTQNLKIYLYNYQTGTAIFLASKHEKTIIACIYLSFYKYLLHFELLDSNTLKNESIHLNSWHHSHKKQQDGLEIFNVTAS